MSQPMQKAPSPRRAVREIKAFTSQLRNLIDFADQLDEAWTAEGTVENAKRELEGLRGQIEKATADVERAEADAAERIAEHKAKSDRAVADLDAKFEAARARHADAAAAMGVESAASLAAATERLRAAEDSASSAEHRLRQLNADIEAASARRDAVRAELAAAASVLASEPRREYQPGSIPIFLIAGAASGARRCSTRALAASGAAAATCNPTA